MSIFFKSEVLDNIVRSIPVLKDGRHCHIDTLKGNQSGKFVKEGHTWLSVDWERTVIFWIMGGVGPGEYPSLATFDKEVSPPVIKWRKFDASKVNNVLPFDRSKIVLDHLCRLKKDKDEKSTLVGVYAIYFPSLLDIENDLPLLFVYDQKTDETLVVLSPDLHDEVLNHLV